MSNKIGRNEKCPCGSGKKYKHCCLKLDNFQSKSETTKDLFSSHDGTDLLKTFSGLTLMPENHGKNVRLEELTKLSLQNFSQGSQAINYQELKTFLDREFSSHHMEDPPTNLFTDLISFYGGDYLILPGITEGGDFILTNLLASIFQWQYSNIPDWFKNYAFHTSKFILTLSNRICEGAGLDRYKEGIFEENLLNIPGNERLNRLKNAVSIRQEEIQKILESNKLDPQIINEFLIDPDDSDINTEINENHPILNKPLLFNNDEYVIISPANLSHALTNLLWDQARKGGCMKEVTSAYHQFVWNLNKFHLSQLGFSRIEIPEMEDNNDLPLFEEFYRFDEDKIALVQFIYDDGQGDIPITIDNVQAITERKLALTEKLNNSNDYSNSYIFDISLFSSVGRPFSFSLQNDKAYQLGIPINEFKTIYQLDHYDLIKCKALNLWKFAVYENDNQAFFPGSTFLDRILVYKDYKDSLYVSDEIQHQFLFVQPGYAADYIKTAKQTADEHSAFRNDNGRLSKVPVLKKTKYSPIYYSEGDLGQAPYLLVESLPVAVWVTPSKDLKQGSKELNHIYFEFLDAFAYWIWQASSAIDQYLKPLKHPLIVSFQLANDKDFVNIQREFSRDSELQSKFSINSSEEGFDITIPSEIIPYLYGTDNEADRNLLEIILQGFDQILTSCGFEGLSHDHRRDIIEEVAPNGYKKKIWLYDTSNNLLLDPTNLPEPRYIQDHDVNQILDMIVFELGDKCPGVGGINSKEVKHKLTKNIVLNVLLPKLSETVHQYDSSQLISWLMGLNESLIYRRQKLWFDTPFRMACFVSEKQHELDLKEELVKLDRTSIASRTLIEHVAAEQPKGSLKLSITAIDYLLALMDQIIMWGSLGDQVKFDLFDVEIEVLFSNRIGVDKEFQDEIFDPYFTSKVTETIQNTHENLHQFFFDSFVDKGANLSDNLDNAFEEEFGISFLQVCNFINDIGVIAYQQATLFGQMDKKQLFTEVNNHDHTFTENEFENAINFLTIFYRGKVTKNPDGFDQHDISPWRYNRRLSLLRKPLVALEIEEDEDNPTLYWGFRQVLLSRMYLQDAFETGRFKCEEGGALDKAIGKISQKRGDELVDSVITTFEGENLITDSEVEIGPNKTFKNEDQLGDIDVLLIDQSSTQLYSIECKAMAPSRNIKEMVEEAEKIIHEYIPKHLRRDVWLRGNLDQVSKEYGVDVTNYQVNSLIVTKESMVTPYLKNENLDLPIISLNELSNHGLQILN